jgi:transcriptional regulator with XRE-family HTH domain
MGRNELARRLGVSSSTIVRWTKGLNEPPYAALREICRLTGTSADEILGIVDLKPPTRRAPRSVEKLLREADRARQRLEAVSRAVRAELDADLERDRARG